MFSKLTTRGVCAAFAALWIGCATYTRAAEPTAPGPALPSEKVIDARGDPTDGWGALSGRFVYTGIPPDGGLAGNVSPTSDAALMVEPTTRGIKNLLIYARKVRRVHPSYGSELVRPDHKTVLEITDHVFDPRVLAMRMYELLTVRNRDPVPHVFLMRPPVGMETNVLLGPGDEVDRQFAHKQYFPVVVNCSFHPWMTAYVLVRDDPYFALTDSYGWFEIRDLPAGEEIEFQVWHELGGGDNGALDAKPQWMKGRFRITIPRDGTADLGAVEVSPDAFRTEKQQQVGETVGEGTR